ncbi:biotin carboxylase [Synergistales bacterium]|nr:biotin carboxylase [Synergistales bacterium]
MGTKTTKKESTAIINSMTSGVVPRIGLEHIAVGRKNETESILRDLSNIGEGAAVFRFICGRYGSGKSFLLQIIRNQAIKSGFIVADVDLSPEKRLTGSANQGLNTYRELLQRMATKARPDGGDMEGLLQKWIENIKKRVIKSGVSLGDSNFDALVEARIIETIEETESFAHGFDFAAALAAYYRSFSSGDDELKQAAVKWLRGEFTTKTAAKSLLKVGEIISDSNWYDYLKLFAFLLSKIGYKGLIIFIDESVSLYKISHRQSREANYEKLLSLFNDTMQGKAQGLGIYMTGTAEFIEDERRGLFSNEPLKTRLTESRFARGGLTDWNSPIIRLRQLTPEEIFILLERLADIHAIHYGYEKSLSNEQIEVFMNLAVSQMGADTMLTPREVSRDFLGLLNIIHQDKSMTFEKLITEGGFVIKSSAENPEDINSEGGEYAAFEV